MFAVRCSYMPVQWVMPCLQWAAGETMCHLLEPMERVRFVCLRAFGDEPAAHVRSFALHEKRVPWE